MWDGQTALCPKPQAPRFQGHRSSSQYLHRLEVRCRCGGYARSHLPQSCRVCGYAVPYRGDSLRFLRGVRFFFFKRFTNFGFENMTA